MRIRENNDYCVLGYLSHLKMNIINNVRYNWAKNKKIQTKRRFLTLRNNKAFDEAKLVALRIPR